MVLVTDDMVLQLGSIMASVNVPGPCLLKLKILADGIYS